MTVPLLTDLRQEVCRQNRRIPAGGLAALTWGNVSGVDRDAGVYVIKPSGVAYDDLTPDMLVPVDLETGAVLAGSLRPSVDSESHRLLYRQWPHVGGITHTHSTHAVAFAQARRAIPVLGTTHADSFAGPVPLRRAADTAIPPDVDLVDDSDGNERSHHRRYGRCSTPVYHREAGDAQPRRHGRDRARHRRRGGHGTPGQRTRILPLYS